MGGGEEDPALEEAREEGKGCATRRRGRGCDQPCLVCQGLAGPSQRVSYFLGLGFRPQCPEVGGMGPGGRCKEEHIPLHTHTLTHWHTYPRVSWTEQWALWPGS